MARLDSPEVTELSVRTSDAFNNREGVLVPELLESRQRRVETCLAVDGKYLARSDRQGSSLVVVVPVGDRDHRVQTIVATEHADDQEDAVVGCDWACRPGRVAANERRVEQR